MGALAIANEDPTGLAASVLKAALDNALDNCAASVQTDGTWTETPVSDLRVPWPLGTVAILRRALARCTLARS